jgi:hypothetical protein
MNDQNSQQVKDLTMQTTELQTLIQKLKNEKDELQNSLNQLQASYKVLGEQVKEYQGEVIVKVYVDLDGCENTTPKIEVYTFNIQAPVDDILIAKDGEVNAYQPQDVTAINTGDDSVQSPTHTGEHQNNGIDKELPSTTNQLYE